MDQNCNTSESNFSFSSSALHFPLISNNSFELNAISLSDDSGFSINANSNARENEHADFNSDEFEEFSQFDSDSGMSAENFQTIKKINNTIIYEPPPEFSDNYSRQAFHQQHQSTTAPSTVIRTTHIQSYASRLTQNIIRAAIKSFQNLATRETHYCEKHAAAKMKKKQKAIESECSANRPSRGFVMSNEYSIYGSDSFLNNYHKPMHQLSNGKNSNSNINIVQSDDDDIYDEPNTEYDIIYKDNKDTILCTRRIVRSLEKKKKQHVDAIYCNTEELFCEKLRAKSYSSSNNGTTNRQSAAAPSDVTNKFQSNSFQKKFDKFLRSKFLTTNLTPTTTTSSIFYSFCHTGTNNNVSNANPTSKSSLNSRLSSSHNSLTVPTNKADDSIFITQAMSHDQLQGHNLEISDFYNVPLDSDIYTLPIDVINNNHHHENERCRHHRLSSSSASRSHHRAMSDNDLLGGGGSSSVAKSHRFHRGKNKRSKRKKRCADESGGNISRKLSNASGSVVTSHSFTVTNNESTSRSKANEKLRGKSIQSDTKVRKNSSDVKVVKGDTNNNSSKYGSTTTSSNAVGGGGAAAKKSQFSISLNLKQKFCSIFRFRKSHQASPTRSNGAVVVGGGSQEEEKKVNLSTRALPPLPGIDVPQTSEKKGETQMDFAANIEKARECGWYWGALTSEAAEKILSNEPDGSFIVRDSSDLNYIFSLTVKLNGCIRHVRIEQEQGSGFSFGNSCAQIKCSYKSSTIKEFIENAVEHSRSGRYLFFLHRRPEHGPMRVQLLNPVSRFRHVQSLQHMCRFVILKAVQRRDHIETLLLPRRLLDYLQNKHFLSELIESDSSSQSQVYGENNHNNSDSN